MARFALAAQTLDQDLGGAPSRVVLGDPDRGQRRVDAVDERHVVEAGDRDVARALKAAAARLRDRADGEKVVGGQHGCRPGLPRG